MGTYILDSSILNPRILNPGLFRSSGGNLIPNTGLLAYVTSPRSDNLIIPEDEEYDEATVDVGFILVPRSGVAIAELWAAVGHTSGVASYWFDADDEPITRLAVGFGSLVGQGISEQAGINTANVLFKLTSAERQTGRLAVYDPAVDSAVLTEAKAILKIT
jgi:hypothetical protein